MKQVPVVGGLLNEVLRVVIVYIDFV
jgi:hypothetical protein